MEEAVSEERSQTIGEAVTGCRRELGVEVSYKNVLLVSAMGLSEEGATADGGESGGAGGAEKRGLWAALQAEGLRRGEEMRLGQVRRVWGRRGWRI
jgi:hypothetical protein